MGFSAKAESYFKKSHTQAKLWVKPLIELASIAMLNSKFDYASKLLKQAENLPNKSLEHKTIAMQFYTLRNQISKADAILSSTRSIRCARRRGTPFSTFASAQIISTFPS